MHGLPKDIDLSFFKNKTLEQVCLGPCTIILDFYKNVSINITGSFSLNGKHFESQEDSRAGHLLHILLEKNINNAKHGNKPGDLVLDFEGKNQLILHEDPVPFESYSFYDPKNNYYVI